jgi:3-deoxy-D-manno-octulosonate 8-phosphate phosphatase KdsC-like HAD superfamily phosphatase
LAEIERVAVIGDVHADWRVLSAVAEQIAAAGATWH